MYLWLLNANYTIFANNALYDNWQHLSYAEAYVRWPDNNVRACVS